MAWAWPFFGWPTAGDAQANQQAARQYFLAVSIQTSPPDRTAESGIGMALAYAAPDSPAAGLATVLQTMWAAAYPSTLNSVGMSTGDLSELPDGFQFCKEGKCHKYGNLRFDKEHRLEDFTTDGIPIAQNTFLGSNTKVSDDVLQERFLGGLQLADGNYYRFVVEIRNNSTMDLDIDPISDFQDDSGQGWNSPLYGRLHLKPGQASQIVTFANCRHGGLLSVTTHANGGPDQKHTLEIP